MLTSPVQAAQRPFVWKRSGKLQLPQRPPMKTLFSSLEVLEARIAPASFVVTNLTDNDPGSLRDALSKADNSAGKDTITFKLAPATGGTENIINLLAVLKSTGDVTITGPGSGKLII